MQYEDIVEKILVLNNEKLSEEMLDYLNCIIDGLKNCLINDMKRNYKSFEVYSYYIQILEKILENKISEKVPILSKESLKISVNKIINGGILVSDIIISNGIIFVKGRNRINPASGEYMELASNANDLLSHNFINIQERNKSVNQEEVRKIYLQILDALDMANKFLLLDNTHIFQKDGNKIIYSSPIVRVYTPCNLNDIERHKDNFVFPVVIKNGEELFSLNISINNGQVRNVEKIDDIWQLRAKEKNK